MKYLRNKTFVKIVSVLIAVLSWIYVVSVEDPKTEISLRNISIKVLNETKLNDHGLQIIDVADDEVDIKVTGRRSEVATVTADEVTAVIDVSEITSSGNHMIDVNIRTNVSGVTLKKADVQKTEVYIDSVKTVSQPITVEVVGEPMEGYILDSVENSVDSIQVKGPNGIINKIASAVVELKVTGSETERITQICPVKLIDYSGAEIDDKYLSLSAKDISVSANILKEQLLDVEPVYSQNYDLSDYEVKITPQSVLAITDPAYNGTISTERITLNELRNGGSFTKKAKLEVPASIKIREEDYTVTIEFRKK